MIFLCPNHRHHLSRNPNAAMVCYYNGMEHGQLASMEHDWFKALKFYGTAYETSAILLNHARANWLKPFVQTSQLVAHALVKLQRYAQAERLLHSALQEIADEPRLHRFITDALENIGLQKQQQYSARHVYFTTDGHIKLNDTGGSNALH